MVKDIDNVDISDISEAATRRGLKGDYEFSNPRGARLLRKFISLKDFNDSAIEEISFNAYLEATTSTTEGRKAGELGGNGPFYYSPSSTGTGAFYWTARNAYNSIKGNNITDERAGFSNLSNISNGNGIKIAVIDIGFQGNNESSMPIQIIGSGTYYFWNQYTYNGYIQGFSGQGDNMWHGRKVVSVIKAPINDFAGTYGTAPSATVLLEHTEDNRLDRVAAAIDQSVSWGARVINMSMEVDSTGFYNIYSPIVNGYNKGVIFVSGTGNKGTSANNFSYDCYPAMYGEVLGVGAHDQDGNNAIWETGVKGSNKKHADIFAAGSWIPVATIPGTSPWEFQLMHGTSYAAPITAGVIACGMAKGSITNYNTPNLSSAQSKLWNTGYNYSVKALNAIAAMQ